MKAWIWGVLGFLSLLWTAVAWLLATLSASAGQWISSGQAKTLGQQAGALPLPDWLALFVDTAQLQQLREALLWLLEAGGGSLPFLGSAVGWLEPLVWVVWALGLCLMLGLGALAHVMVGRSHLLKRATG